MKTTAKQVQKKKRVPSKAVQAGAARARRTKSPSAADFLAHAIAIEREAAASYRELAFQMESVGNTKVAELFQRLARMEKLHELGLQSRAQGLKLPRIPERAHAWLDAGPTEVPRYELLFNRVQAHQVLLLALRAEQNARDYFERVGKRSEVAEIRELAEELVADEAEHIQWIERAIEQEPAAPVEDDFA